MTDNESTKDENIQKDDDEEYKYTQIFGKKWAKLAEALEVLRDERDWNRQMSEENKDDKGYLEYLEEITDSLDIAIEILERFEVEYFNNMVDDAVHHH